MISRSLFNDQAYLNIDWDKPFFVISITESLVQSWHLNQGLPLLEGEFVTFSVPILFQAYKLVNFPLAFICFNEVRPV